MKKLIQTIEQWDARLKPYGPLLLTILALELVALAILRHLTK